MPTPPNMLRARTRGITRLSWSLTKVRKLDLTGTRHDLQVFGVRLAGIGLTRHRVYALPATTAYSLPRWKHPPPPPLTSRPAVLRPRRPRQLHPARSLGHIALVPSAHLGEMAQQGTLEALGQHRHTVAVTLSAPHPDLVRREIEVLRPQAQRLEQPHPAPIQQPRDQPDGTASLEARQHAAHLIARQHDGHSPRPLGPHQRRQPPDWRIQDLAIQEDERG